MAIVQKAKLKSLLDQLDATYQTLRKTLDGTAPNPNVYNQYRSDPRQFAEECCEVDPIQVTIALKQFRAVLDVLAKPNNWIEPPPKRSR